MTRIGLTGLIAASIACSQAVASGGGGADGPVNVALVQFGYCDSDSRWISNTLHDRLEEGFEASPDYSMVGENDLSDAFSDLGFESADLQYGVPPDVASQAAVAVGADLILFGVIYPDGMGTYSISWNIGVASSGSTITPAVITNASKDGAVVASAADQMVQSAGQEVGARAQSALQMAEYHASVENWPMAIASLRQALQVDAGLTEAKLMLASIYMRSEVDSLDQARAIYDDILSSDPVNSEALSGMGQLLLDGGDPEGAKDFFDRAIAANPDNAQAYVGLASAYNAMGMMDEAVQSFESALAQNPQNLQARYALGLLYMELGRQAEAIPHLEQVLQVHPDFTNLRLKLVSAYSEVGRNGDAADNAVIILESDPGNTQLALYTAQLEAWAGRSGSAVQRLEGIISSTGDRQAYLLLATVYRDSGQYGSMQQVFNRLRSAYPNDPVANFMVGAFYYQNGTRNAQVPDLVLSNIPVWEEAISDLQTAVSYLSAVTGYRSGQAQEMISAANNAIALCEEKIDRVRRYSE